ncbi:MAG: DUF3575 domain-containing protein [Bacteroidales bacterium]
MSKSINRRLGLLLLFVVVSTLFSSVFAQRFAVKSNALLWATLSPNFGAELVVSDKYSIDVSMAFNPFTIKDYKANFVEFQPKVKYWFGRPLSEHFVGITGLYGVNSFHRKQRESGVLVSKDVLHGDVLGGGFSYGYNFVLSRRWNLELSAGVGVIYSRQFSYDALENSSRPPESEMCRKWSIAPIDLGVSFIYIIN